MPYEVIKRVGTRAYRYRVESYRDAATHKSQARWTYLGRVAPGALDEPSETATANGFAPVKRRSAATRERLIDAFEKALETIPYQRLTANVVAREAGVAHGTFYRYFSDKRALFDAALERARTEFDRSLPALDAPYGDAAAERARVRRWVTTLLASKIANLGSLRAYLDALETDAALRGLRAERRKNRADIVTSYLVSLDAGGIASIARPRALAATLITLTDATLRSAIASGARPSEAEIDGVCDVFERAIFSTID